MMAPWVIDELKTTDLLDKRLDDRLHDILNDLAERPTASIPAACKGYAETTAAYRFFENPKTNFQNVLAPHRQATLQRMAREPVVLLVNDTTELDLSRPQQQVQGAGPLGSDARRGLFSHLLHGFTPEGVSLGTCWAETWARSDEDDQEQSKTATQKGKERQKIPIEQKESYRWVQGLRQAQHAAEQLPGVHCVYVADSEGDIYEVFAEAQRPSRVDILVRASQDRAVLAEPDSAGGLLRQRVLSQPVLFTHTISVRGREAKVACETRARRVSRGPRQATVEVRAAQVRLRPPKRVGQPKLPEVSLNVVLVREVNPPEGESPVEWLLLTTLPIDEVEQVRRVIQYYTVRFLIEVLFRVLKSGCRIEERRFEHVDHLLPCLAVYLIVAWRTLYLVRLGRSFPDLECEAVFEPSEWKPVYMAVRQQAPPATPPRLSEMIRMVAQLGGYIDRKQSGPPGVQTVWLGLQRMNDLALAWNTFGPGANPERGAFVPDQELEYGCGKT
jgi:hypothetical protein